MTVAVVLVFLLNGVQVDLPAPALMIGESACVPARAVLEQLGWKVEWNPEQRRLRASVEGLAAYYFTVGDRKMTLECSVCPTTPAGKQKTLEAAPAVVGGYLYLPVRALAIMTASRVEWDAPTMTVNLLAEPIGQPQAVEIGTILADPLAWMGQLVRLRGEYTGWQADPVGPAVAHGPPVTRGDWTIRDMTGSLYCSPGPTTRLPLALDPQADLGRRLEVVGIVALTEGGWPYLQANDVTLLNGLDGITCYLTTDRNTYQPGETVRMRMQVFNPTTEAQVLHSSTSQQFDFTARNPDGEAVWKWSQGKAFAQMLTEKAIKPGEGYAVTAEWPLPQELPPARYQVTGELNREVQSYAKTISVEEVGEGNG